MDKRDGLKKRTSIWKGRGKKHDIGSYSHGIFLHPISEYLNIKICVVAWFKS